MSFSFDFFLLLIKQESVYNFPLSSLSLPPSNSGESIYSKVVDYFEQSNLLAQQRAQQQ